MKHFIYRTTCVLTDRYYLGKHSTRNIDDGYLGSGKLLKRSIEKHGRENHVVERLEFFETLDLLNRAERRLISEHFDDAFCMNISPGGAGGTTFRSLASRRKQSESRRGKRYQKQIDSIRGKSSPMKGRKHKPESIEKLKQNHWKGCLYDYRKRNP